MTKYLRTSILVALLLTGTTELNSIAQINYTAPKVYQVQTEKLYQMASISDTTEKSKEVKEVKEVVDEWYIPYLEKEFGFNYEYQEFLHKECEKRKLPYLLIVSQIRCESTFNQKLVGSDNDIGFMQIRKGVWQDYLSQELNRKVDLYDGFDNLESGCLLMQYAMASADKFNNEKEQIIRALNSYNQGGQSSLNYAKRNGWNAHHYGKRVYKCFQEYKDGNFSYDPYK